jgi:hypothetical protein
MEEENNESQKRTPQLPFNGRPLDGFHVVVARIILWLACPSNAQNQHPAPADSGQLLSSPPSLDIIVELPRSPPSQARIPSSTALAPP